MAALDIVTLDTATPQLEVPQAADTYNAPRAFAIAPVALTGSAATTSFDVTQTWNTTGTPSALKLNVTDTASNAASLLMDLQVGGASRFAVVKSGAISCGNITCGDIKSSVNTFLIDNGSGSLRLFTDTWLSRAATGTMTIGSAVNSSNGTLRAAVIAVGDDAILARDAADTLAQRRGTNAQTFRIYNTFTDASNYERGKMEWASNVLRIGTEKAGTGTARALELQTDGTTRLTIESGGLVVVAGELRVQGSSGARIFESAGMRFNSGDVSRPYVFEISNVSITTSSTNPTIQFGGTTSSFPALKRSSAALIVRLADDTANAALESASVKTDAPAGGTSGTWKLGVAATVSPTSPNRTIEVDIGGTIYYLAAKTTND